MSEWFLDEQTPLEFDRPEWMPEKFKSVQDMARGYQSLEQKLGSAPAEYSLEKAESWLDSSYEGVQTMLEVAKEKRVPQEVLDTMFQVTGDYLSQYRVDYDKEKEKLGKDAKERIERVEDWAKSNLSESAFNALTNSLDTADGVMAVEELRNLYMNNQSQIPSSNEQQIAPSYTVDDVRTEIEENLDKYKSDSQYRAQLQAKLEKVSKDSGYIDKTFI
jgi:gas vesicle protein